jgi:hypothetical protein
MSDLQDKRNQTNLIEISTDETLIDADLQIEEFTIETSEDFEAFVENTLQSGNNPELYERFGIWGEAMNHIHIITNNWEEGFLVAKALEQEIPPILNPNILNKLYDRISKINDKETLLKLISAYNTILKESSNLHDTLEN